MLSKAQIDEYNEGGAIRERDVLSPAEVAGLRHVTDQILERSAATTRPRLRYLVGRDGKTLLLLKRLLPDSAFERVKRRLSSRGTTAASHLQTLPHEPAASDDAAAR